MANQTPFVIDGPPIFSGGVSQQDSTHRLRHQSEEQINCWASPIEGLRPRHSTNHVARLFSLGHTGSWAMFPIVRSPQRRVMLALSHQEAWGVNLVTGDLVPVLARRQAEIELLSVPADGTAIAITPGPAGGSTKSIIFDGTSTPADSDPNYYIDTSVYNTVDSARRRLAYRIREITSGMSKLCETYDSGSRAFVYDYELANSSASYTFIAKSGGDSATSVRIRHSTLEPFRYLKALTTPQIPLLTPEDMTLNMGTSTESPVAVTPNTNPWKVTGTAGSVAYSTTTGSMGPHGGGYTAALLQAVSSGTNQEATFYYRFVASGEPTQYNTFAPAATTQVVSAYLRAAGSDAIGTFRFGFLNASDSTWRAIDVTVAGGASSDMSVAATVGGATGGVERVGRDGFWRVWCAYKTTTEAASQRRIGLRISLATNGLNKLMVAYGWKLEHKQASTPGDFFQKINEVYRGRPVGDTVIVSNASVNTAIDASSTSTARAVYEGYVDLKNWNYSLGFAVYVVIGTHSFRVAAKVAPTTSGASGVAHCVNGQTAVGPAPISGAYITACAASNGGKGVPVSSGAEVVRPDGDRIAQQLADMITSAITATANGDNDGYCVAGISGGVSIATARAFTVERQGAVLRLTANAAFSIDTVDGNGSPYLKRSTDEAGLVDDLPSAAKDGYKVRITRKSDVRLDDYIVAPTLVNISTFSKVVAWEESVGYGAHIRFDASTMPHQFVLKQDTAGTKTGNIGADYIEFEPIDWEDKAAGDDDLNPDPGFIEAPIYDIDFSGGRFFMAARTRAHGSSANSFFFNFWRTVCRRVDDDDPIDPDAVHSTISELRDFVNTGTRLIARSDLGLFELDGNPRPTPDSARLVARDQIPSYASVHAIPYEQSAMFLAQRGNGSRTAVLEAMTSEEGTNFRTMELTEAVPTYLLGTPIRIAGSQTAGVVAVLTSGLPNGAYIARLEPPRPQAVRSAWWSYTLGPSTTVKVRDVAFVEDVLYFLIERDYDMVLESMPIGDALYDSGSGLSQWSIHLDRRVSDSTAGVSKTYSGANNWTEYTLPYKIDSGVTMAAYRVRDGAELTVLGDTVNGTVSKIFISGNQIAEDVWIGALFDASYTMSKHQLRDQSGDIISAKQVLSEMVVSYHRTRAFRVEVTVKGNASATTRTFDVTNASDAISVASLTAAATSQMAVGRGVTRNNPFLVGADPDEATIVIRNYRGFPFALSKAHFLVGVTPKGQRA